MSDEATASLGGAGCGSVVLHGKYGAAMICVSRIPMPESVACGMSGIAISECLRRWDNGCGAPQRKKF